MLYIVFFVVQLLIISSKLPTLFKFIAFFCHTLLFTSLSNRQSWFSFISQMTRYSCSVAFLYFAPVISNLSNSGVYSYSSSASILSIINKEGLAPFKSMVSSPQHAIYRSSGDGPTFSGGHDSHISNNSNSHIGSYTNFYNSYCLISSGVQNTKTVLDGSYGLALNEVEVAYLTWVTWQREQIINDEVDFFFYHRSDLYTSSEEFFKAHWYRVIWIILW